jgi:hypothetical protein
MARGAWDQEAVSWLSDPLESLKSPKLRSPRPKMNGSQRRRGPTESPAADAVLRQTRNSSDE